MSDQEPQSGWETLMKEAPQELTTWRQQQAIPLSAGDNSAVVTKRVIGGGMDASSLECG